MSLSTKVMNAIANTTTQTSRYQDTLTQEINKMYQNVANATFFYSEYNKIKNVMDQMIISTHISVQILYDLENGIAFFRLNFLHNSIQNLNNLHRIVKELNKYHCVKQLLFDNKNLLNYYDIEKTYYLRKRIIFILYFSPPYRLCLLSRNTNTLGQLEYINSTIPIYCI